MGAPSCIILKYVLITVSMSYFLIYFIKKVVFPNRYCPGNLQPNPDPIFQTGMTLEDMVGGEHLYCVSFHCNAESASAFHSFEKGTLIFASIRRAIFTYFYCYLVNLPHPHPRPSTSTSV